MVSGPIGQPRAYYGGVGVTGEQYQFVRNAILGGLSGNAVSRQLRGTELAIRDSALFAIRREVLDMRQSAQIINNTPYNFYPSDRAFTPTAMPLGGRYRISAYVFDPTSPPDFPQQIWATVTYNTRLTRGALTEAALSTLQKTFESRGITDENGNINIAAGDIKFDTAETEL